MHDESLDKTAGIQNAYIKDHILGLVSHFGIPEDKATVVLGYAMKKSNDFLGIKDIIAYIDTVKKVPIKFMSEDEKQMLLALGFLTRKKKQIPFKSEEKIGRNDDCPCGSGLKYKKCCLEIAKVHDLERYNNGKQK